MAKRSPIQRAQAKIRPPWISEALQRYKPDSRIPAKRFWTGFRPSFDRPSLTGCCSPVTLARPRPGSQIRSIPACGAM
jgi:hypothetical protein